jgi:hypothetical protein
MKSKYVVLNKYGRPFAVADSLQDIADRTGVPLTSIHLKYQQGKPIRGQFLVMLREKHEYLWHKYGGRHGGDDFFAFCSSEELRAFKENERRTFLDICDKYKPMRL